MKHKLDRTDLRILTQLQTNSAISNLQLAEQVGISPAACSRRVRRLRESGVILREIAVIDPSYACRQMTAFIEITLERHSKSYKEAFLRRIAEHPDITQCYMVTGDTDLLLVVQVENMAGYDEFRSDLLDQNQNVLRYRTVLSIRRIKFDPTTQLGG